MKAILVDDERLAAEVLRAKLEHIPRITEVKSFTSPLAALEFAAHNDVDVAFLDISMAEMNGLSLALRFRERWPQTGIIFTTGYADYALDAYKLHADGYLLKPVEEEDIERELDNLSRQKLTPEKAKRIRAQTFGSFEFFVDDEPVRFKRSKTKELLAYLIDRRGAAANSAEICAVLWEEQSESDAGYMRHLVSDLKKSLKSVNASDVFIAGRNNYAVDTRLIDCDAYRFRRRDMAAINAYNGEYMTQYSWAELTLGGLESEK